MTQEEGKLPPVVQNSFQQIELCTMHDVVPIAEPSSQKLPPPTIMPERAKEVFEKDTDYWLPKTKAIFVETHDRMRKGSSKAVFNAISQYNFSFSTSDENLVFINEDLLDEQK